MGRTRQKNKGPHKNKARKDKSQKAACQKDNARRFVSDKIIKNRAASQKQTALCL
jgi:hypothetical protein